MDELVVFMIIALLYFIPAMLAYDRNHPHMLGIFLLNLFLGWTFLFWVAALIWAATLPRYARNPGSA